MFRPHSLSRQKLGLYLELSWLLPLAGPPPNTCPLSAGAYLLGTLTPSLALAACLQLAYNPYPYVLSRLQIALNDNHR
ncbi:hypothetical protein DFP72DRAFT_875868 [Ephemerocybe angulata]|uniref:Uncharacterized protein n=1 Tax=Ephemerocybe angulata TaxID=980116 RepID=A0A8H6LTM5_9AGAR|nr:hypothetical protein DFP72DRAFT_941618 [Tulosesus angulatus]KAF6762415.1 hypothetical protein DFP72DRAFT_875868 [Tulosesus angulatus]